MKIFLRRSSRKYAPTEKRFHFEYSISPPTNTTGLGRRRLSTFKHWNRGGYNTKAANTKAAINTATATAIMASNTFPSKTTPARLFRSATYLAGAECSYAEAAKVSLDGSPLRFVAWRFAASSGVGRSRAYLAVGHTGLKEALVRCQCVGANDPR
jgi:hypothetical protein